MKILFLFFILAVCQISGTPFSAESDEVNTFPPPPTALMARNTRIIDFYAITRSFIQSLINDLRSGANSASIVITRLLEITGRETNNFLVNLNSTLSNIQQNMNSTIANIINNGNQASSIYLCISSQTNNINSLMTNTLRDITGCVVGTISGFTSVAEEGRRLIRSAISAADNISNQTLACGVASFSNFVEVGRCLNAVYANARLVSNTFIAQLTELGVRATIMITSSPIDTAACGTTQLANTAIVAGQIVQNITRCASVFVNRN